MESYRFMHVGKRLSVQPSMDVQVSEVPAVVHNDVFYAITAPFLRTPGTQRAPVYPDRTNTVSSNKGPTHTELPHLSQGVLLLYGNEIKADKGPLDRLNYG